MAAKAFLFLCAQALLSQTVFSQCTSSAAVDASGIGAPYGRAGSLAAPGFASPGLKYDGFAAPWSNDRLAFPGAGCAGRGQAYDGFYSPAMEFSATSGGALPVTSSSAMAPVGISIVSDNAYEGILSVAGELPFVGTTAMEGVLPTTGSGAVNYGCGNGINAMSALSATSTPASVATMTGQAFGTPTFGYDGLMAPTLAYDGSAYSGVGLAGRGIGCNNGLAYASPIDAIEITPTSGGALPVSSASAIPPTGIALASDNAYEGALAVGGELPFVGTVAMEGVVPSAGAGAVNHACGNGRNAMISENAAFAPAGAYGPMTSISPAGAFSPAAAFGSGFGSPALGYRGGWAGRGCGCGF